MDFQVKEQEFVMQQFHVTKKKKKIIENLFYLFK